MKSYQYLILLWLIASGFSHFFYPGDCAYKWFFLFWLVLGTFSGWFEILIETEKK
jgi:hypothetical protein